MSDGPCCVACIKETNTKTYCGRFFSDNEYVFGDARYAVAIYEHGKHLRACTECVKFAQESFDDISPDLSHVSTRGIKGL